MKYFEIPTKIIDSTMRAQNDFLWNSIMAKINHESVCSDYQNCGLKNVDSMMESDTTKIN